MGRQPANQPCGRAIALPHFFLVVARAETQQHHRPAAFDERPARGCMASMGWSKDNIRTACCMASMGWGKDKSVKKKLVGVVLYGKYGLG